MKLSVRANWPRYRLYGITMASDFVFANHLPRTGTPPDLYFERTTTPPQAIDFAALSPVYTSPSRAPDGSSVICVHAGEELGDVIVVRFAGTADHYLYPDRIICHCPVPAADYLVEIQLLSYILSIWLERQGIVALHAAAIVVQGCAMAFLASNRGGKSSLAASFMQAGFPLLTDDILALECRAKGITARPGYPQMRFWPDEAGHFLGHEREFDRVHPAFAKLRIPVGPHGLGRLWNWPTPLGWICLPEIREDSDDRVEIETVPPREMFAQLLRHSFAGAIVETLGWQVERLSMLADAVNTVPALRLRCPKGLGALPGVRQDVLRMLRSKQPKAMRT